MLITEHSLRMMGIEPVLEFLELEDKFQLRDFMVERGMVYLWQLADFLSQHAVVCEYCAQKLVNINVPEPFCNDCLDAIYVSFK